MRPQKGKQKLFDAALQLFESQGYFSTTVEQITERAGVSKGLVYNYFPSKEALLVGLLEDATRRMGDVAEKLELQLPAEESLLHFLDAYLQFLRTERRFLKLQLTLLMMPELQQVVAEPQRKRAALLLGMLSRWFRQADCPNPKKRARLLLAALDGVALHFLCIYENYPLASMKPQLVLLTQMLCAQKKKDQV